MIFTELKALFDLCKDVSELMDRDELKSLDEMGKKVFEELYKDNIRICIHCCGFVDKTAMDCPQCFGNLGVSAFGHQRTQHNTIKIKEFDEKYIIDYINEGQYCGRYSRGDTIRFNN